MASKASLKLFAVVALGTLGGCDQGALPKPPQASKQAEPPRDALAEQQPELRVPRTLPSGRPASGNVNVRPLPTPRTYRNGRPISGPAALGFGDEIGVGQVRFRLERARRG